AETVLLVGFEFTESAADRGEQKEGVVAEAARAARFLQDLPVAGAECRRGLAAGGEEHDGADVAGRTPWPRDALKPLPQQLVVGAAGGEQQALGGHVRGWPRATVQPGLRAGARRHGRGPGSRGRGDDRALRG